MRTRASPEGRGFESRRSLVGEFRRPRAHAPGKTRQRGTDGRGAARAPAAPDTLRLGDGVERTTDTREGVGGPGEQAVLLAAGLADLAVTTVGAAFTSVRGLLRRSDTAELAAGAEQDLIARGRLALDRYATAPPAHLEVLARQVIAQRADGGDSDGGRDGDGGRA